MAQPEIQQTFDSVSLEGLDEIYQPDPTLAQTAPDLAQSDPISEAQIGPDPGFWDNKAVQRNPTPEVQTDPHLEIQPDPSQGVSLEDAAKVLGLHIDTVRKRLQKGKIKGFKVAEKFGDKWLVHKDELEKSRPAHPTLLAQPAPEQVQADPVDQAQSDPPQVQADLVEIEVALEQVQTHPTPPVQADPEHQRLMAIIENQAHQLKAAGDVILYLRSEVDDTKGQLKLLTDSKHNQGRWHRFFSWFLGTTP